MLVLQNFLATLSGLAEGIYYLTHEEKVALYWFNLMADQGETHRLYLLQLAQEHGIEPGQLIYLRQLAEQNVGFVE